MELSPRIRYKLDRYKQQLEGIFGGGEKENPRPRLCPSCGTLVGATATKCATCGANVNFGFAAATKGLSRLLPAESPVTYIILGITCIFYAITFAVTVRYSGLQAPGGGFGGLMGLGGVSGGVLDFFGASRPWPGDLQFFPWRLIMPTLLHGSLLHIGFNMWVLMDVGPQIEELYGSARYIFIYFLTGVGAYLVSGIFGRVPSIGASGAILGLIGVMLAITTKREGEHIRMLRNQLLKWVAYIAIMGFFMSGIDNWAHGGGLATGFIVGKLMADRRPMSPTENRIASILGWGTGLVVLACIVFTSVVAYVAIKHIG